jgi:hypothetical protein
MFRRVIRSLFLLCVVVALTAPVGGQSPNDVAVVANADVPLDGLSLYEVRRLVLGERDFWTPGNRVTLILNAPGAHEREIILKTICRMTEAQFRQHWLAKMFRADTVIRPRIVDTTEMIIDLATRTPGAVAFVDASRVGRNVKVLKIDGLAPGERGYPIH